jgi:hypothetical protein
MIRNADTDSSDSVPPNPGVLRRYSLPDDKSRW